jgi:hypothetical protein
MSSGEKNKGNYYPVLLTLEGKMALRRYMHDQGLLSDGQAINQCAMKFLHEHGYMTEIEWRLLQDSRVMKTGQDFIQEKTLKIRRRIEEERIETSTVILPGDQEQLLQKTYERVMGCQGELKNLGSFYKTYKERAAQLLPHPMAERILEEFSKYERR